MLPPDAGPVIRTRDLGRMGYREAYAEQIRTLERVLAARAEATAAYAGEILLVEHDPVITVTPRAARAGHLLASVEVLARLGVTLEETDRGGDITYHGPGQLVAYPILDLNALNLGLHDYVRLLEEAMIRTLAAFGIAGLREPGATGVWVDRAEPGASGTSQSAKIGAIGVRVRRWVAMHGLALNVTPNLEHFNLIVPCGLLGRPVTSMARLLADTCPGMDVVRARLGAILIDAAGEAWARRGAR